jgi:hypothetical protein
MAKEEKHATTTIGQKVNASIEVRTAFEIILYELAQQHAIGAEEASKRKSHGDELRHTIRAIILATACLEAFINQEAIQVLGHDFHDYDKGDIDVWGKTLNERRGYPSLEDKWCEVTNRISNKKLNKGNKPFQDFHKLVELRNEILHYKATSAPPVPSPWQDVPGSVTPERAKFNAKAAQEVVKSMRAMLEQFHVLTGKQKPVWLK